MYEVTANSDKEWRVSLLSLRTCLWDTDTKVAPDKKWPRVHARGPGWGDAFTRRSGARPRGRLRRFSEEAPAAHYQA